MFSLFASYRGVFSLFTRVIGVFSLFASYRGVLSLFARAIEVCFPSLPEL